MSIIVRSFPAYANCDMPLVFVAKIA